MPVYMIRAGEHGPVKIGWTDDVGNRLRIMQIGNHEKLVVIRLFEGGETEEAALHKRFADQHLRGEWHHFSKAMLGDVGLVESARHRESPDRKAFRAQFWEYLNSDPAEAA
jgi:hypothetical protein